MHTMLQSNAREQKMPKWQLTWRELFMPMLLFACHV